MKRFEKGVEYYTRGEAPIYFPENDICCHWCPFAFKDAMDRIICKGSGEIVPNAESMRGARCPLKFEEVEENGQ